MNEVAGSP